MFANIMVYCEKNNNKQCFLKISIKLIIILNSGKIYKSPLNNKSSVSATLQ